MRRPGGWGPVTLSVACAASADPSTRGEDGAPSSAGPAAAVPAAARGGASSPRRRRGTGERLPKREPLGGPAPPQDCRGTGPPRTAPTVFPPISASPSRAGAQEQAADPIPPGAIAPGPAAPGPEPARAGPAEYAACGPRAEGLRAHARVPSAVPPARRLRRRCSVGGARPREQRAVRLGGAAPTSRPGRGPRGRPAPAHRPERDRSTRPRVSRRLAGAGRACGMS